MTIQTSGSSPVSTVRPFPKRRTVGALVRRTCLWFERSPCASQGKVALFGVPLSILLVALGALLLAGFVKGFIGMGLPKIATGLLTLVMAQGGGAGLLVVTDLRPNVMTG